MTLTHAQKTGLEAAILAYLVAEGTWFARTVAAFKEESLLPGGGGDADDNLAVSGAVLEKAWAFVRRNMDCADKYTGVFDAVASGDLAEVQLYACVGVDVKSLRHDDDDGLGLAEPPKISPLYWAARHNHVYLVQYFVQSGHDKEVGSSHGSSPLFIAAQFGHDAVVRYLLEQGADKDNTDDSGWTPLLMAAESNHFVIVQYLVNRGADKDRTNNTGYTPLSMAARRGHFEVMRYLVEQGADMNKADTEGKTALMDASRNGYASVVEYLLDHGCDRDRADNEGWTALHHASQNGRLAVVRVLFRYGVKLDARTNDGETPADLATLYGHDHIADAIRAEEIRRRDYGFKRDPSTIEGTEEHEAAKRPLDEELQKAEAVVESNDDDDDDDDDDDEEENEAGAHRLFR